MGGSEPTKGVVDAPGKRGAEPTPGALGNVGSWLFEPGIDTGGVGLPMFVDGGGGVAPKPGSDTGGVARPGLLGGGAVPTPGVAGVGVSGVLLGGGSTGVVIGVVIGLPVGGGTTGVVIGPGTVGVGVGVGVGETVGGGVTTTVGGGVKVGGGASVVGVVGRGPTVGGGASWAALDAVPTPAMSTVAIVATDATRRSITLRCTG